MTKKTFNGEPMQNLAEVYAELARSDRDMDDPLNLMRVAEEYDASGRMMARGFTEELNRMAKTHDKRRFNGKPMSHWETMAKDLVADSLVRAALALDNGTHTTSLPGRLAAQQIFELVRAHCGDAALNKVLFDRHRFQHGMVIALSRMLPDPPAKSTASRTRRKAVKR